MSRLLAYRLRAMKVLKDKGATYADLEALPETSPVSSSAASSSQVPDAPYATLAPDWVCEILSPSPAGFLTTT